MTPLKEFIEKFNCEEVGMRLIAVVNGQKQYVADILDGGYTLSYHGHMLVEQAEAKAAAEAVEAVDKPRTRRKKEADPAPDAVDSDLAAGLE